MCTYNLSACDFCNCYLGLNPHYKKDNVGIRYQYSEYTGTHHDLSEFTDQSLSKDDFWEKRSVTELHGQWYPSQKLQMIFSVPYIHNSEGASAKGIKAMSDHSHGDNADDGPIMGIGDPYILAHYQVFNRSKMDSTRFSHRLLAGGGLKFPAGKYKLGSAAEPMERTHQPGTGSWDFILSSTYLGKIKRTGFNVNATYLFTNINNEGFQFGNKLNLNAIVYHELKVKKSTLYPNIGTYFEQAAQDWNDGYYLSNSGGSIYYAHAGLDYYYNKLSISMAVQKPFAQKLNAPQPEMNFRVICGISYAID